MAAVGSNGKIVQFNTLHSLKQAKNANRIQSPSAYLVSTIKLVYKGVFMMLIYDIVVVAKLIYKF